MRLPFTLAIALACAPHATMPTPYTRIDLPVGGAPGAVAVVEATGDGAADILVAVDGRIVVWAADDANGFEPRFDAPAGENPNGLATGDLDGDGRLDVAIANHETDYLTLLLGSDGGFTPAPGSPLRIEVDPHPHAVRIADLDEDGRADLVFDDRGRHRLSVLAGDGTGRFTPGGAIDVGGDPYRGMTLADLDGDGHLDAIAPIERAVAVRLGDGSGGFSAAGALEADGLTPFASHTLDWNGDGHPDIAAGSGEGETGVVVFLGDGTGGFGLAPGAPFEAGRGPKALAAADLDGDGADDLLVTAWGAPVLTILYGGEGGPRSATLAVGANPFGVAVGDLNADGRPDIVTANQGSGSVSVLLSDPSGG